MCRLNPPVFGSRTRSILAKILLHWMTQLARNVLAALRPISISYEQNTCHVAMWRHLLYMTQVTSVFFWTISKQLPSNLVSLSVRVCVCIRASVYSMCAELGLCVVFCYRPEVHKCVSFPGVFIWSQCLSCFFLLCVCVFCAVLNSEYVPASPNFIISCCTDFFLF